VPVAAVNNTEISGQTQFLSHFLRFRGTETQCLESNLSF